MSAQLLRNSHSIVSPIHISDSLLAPLGLLSLMIQPSYTSCPVYRYKRPFNKMIERNFSKIPTKMHNQVEESYKKNKADRSISMCSNIEAEIHTNT